MIRIIKMKYVMSVIAFVYSLTFCKALDTFSISNVDQVDEVGMGQKANNIITLKNISRGGGASGRGASGAGGYYPPYVALAAKVGTLGPGGELTLGIADTINVRAGGYYLPIGFSGTIGDVEFETELRWASVPLLVDWHIFGNNFRITGGAIYNRNKAKLEAKLKDQEKIGDHYYTPEEIGTLKGTVDFKKWAPYVGIGYGNAVGGPDTVWNFVFDIGVMFQGSPEVELTADGTMAGNPIFDDDLNKLRQDVQDGADYFQLYPVISFGISYQF